MKFSFNRLSIQKVKRNNEIFVVLFVIYFNYSFIEVCHDADFVSWRGIFARIAATPSNKDEHWMFAVVCYKSVIFLCEYPTEQKLTMLANMSNRDKIMAYWGFKFEQFMTSSHPEVYSFRFVEICME